MVRRHRGGTCGRPNASPREHHGIRAKIIDPSRKRGGSDRRKTPAAAAAERALAEAAARRAERGRTAPDQPKEIGGRDGPEPTRYGDWEVNGLTSDF